MNKLKPISTAPKDRDILIAWGSKASGCEGFLVGHSEERASLTGKKDFWVDQAGNQIESDGYRVFGWTELPELPSEIVVD